MLDCGNLLLLLGTCRSLESSPISPDPFFRGKNRDEMNPRIRNNSSSLIRFADLCSTPCTIPEAGRLRGVNNQLRQSLQRPILKTNLTRQLQTNSKHVENRLFFCYFKNSFWISILNSFQILCLKTDFTFYMAKLHFKSKTVPQSF